MRQIWAQISIQRNQINQLDYDWDKKHGINKDKHLKIVNNFLTYTREVEALVHYTGDVLEHRQKWQWSGVLGPIFWACENPQYLKHNCKNSTSFAPNILDSISLKLMYINSRG